MALRIFALFMALVFAFFAVVQYNDPDPHIWIPIYLFPMILSLMYYRGQGNKMLLWGAAAVFLAGAIYMWPAHWEGVALQNGMKTVNIEEGRESLGLAVGFVTLAIYALTWRGDRRRVHA